MAAQEKILWRPRNRNYKEEKREKLLKGVLTNEHPLKPIVVSETKIRKTGGKTPSSPSVPGPQLLATALEGSDPLSQLDPLSAALHQQQLQTSKKTASGQGSETKTDGAVNQDMEDFEPWDSKKAGILSKFTTSEKLSIVTSFLSASDKEKVVVRTQLAQASVSDKVKNRLEQLDDFEDGSMREMLNLSQQDFVNRIQDLNNALISAWELDHRVKALKIVIQCAKLLADTSVIQFYPSKFVLVTDILDTFGNLVFDRIRRKATYFPPGSKVATTLPENFSPSQVPDSAKETCKNWFFKIASIRELVPRLYVEAAILKCYSFLTTGEYSQALLRLGSQMRGIGDPLVAVYARTYLCRVGMSVAPDVKDHLITHFHDFIATFPQVEMSSVRNILAIQRVDMGSYLVLYTPALDWILQCVAYKASEEILTEILVKCKKQCNSALLLNSIMSAFRPDFMAARSLAFTELIRECQDSGFPKHQLYRSLGVNLVLATPPEDQRLSSLNEVWKVVGKLKSPAQYMECAEVWIEFPCKYFKKKEINTILGDIIRHMTPDHTFEDHYPQLQSIVAKVLSHTQDFSALFSMDKFMPFIDMFQKESVKVEVCKSITETYSQNQTEQSSDPVIVNALMFVCKTMHNSVNALSVEDERRGVSNLIRGFIRKVSYGRDFEQQLDFYVEARANFTNLEPVLIELVQRVNNLAIETRKIMKGNHSQKTAAFVRACSAYCFITIPSIVSVFTQLKLYLLSGQVALLNRTYSQADSFFKACVSLVPQVPQVVCLDPHGGGGKVRSSQPLLRQCLSQLLSTLLTVPDNPEQGVLYLARGLLNVLQDYVWEDNVGAKVATYMEVLDLFSALSQEDYLYHADRVDSNDSMYGSDKKFLAEIGRLSSTLVDEILEQLKQLADSEGGARKQQSWLALNFFNHVVAHCDLSDPKMATFALNLWNLAQKQGNADTKLMVKSLEYVKLKGVHHQHYLELSLKMPLQSRT